MKKTFELVRWRYRSWRTASLILAVVIFCSMPVRAEQDPVEMLQSMSDTLIELVKKDPTILDDHERLRSYAYDLVVPNIDFIALSQWVLGKHWRQATPQQRRIFSEEFREVLIKTYLASFSTADYTGQTIEYLPVREGNSPNKVTVRGLVEQPNGPVVHVQFRLYNRGSRWKVYDVVIEGVSLVATHRSTFSRIIRKKGLDGLIAMLADRNTEVINLPMPDITPNE